MIFLELFWAFAQIGILSFGGAYAALPHIQAKVVDDLGWMSEAEFADVLVISEMTPGPITINTATFVGTTLGGLGGAISATLGFVFPSIIIISIFSILLKKYGDLKAVRDVLSILRPCVIGLIASAGAKMLVEAISEGSVILDTFDIWAAIMFAVGIFVLRKWKPSPIIVMASCGVIGGIVYGALGL